MTNYTKGELDEALRAISSTIGKIEKVAQKKTLGKSQQTLIERRLNALRIAVNLIEAERKKISK